ncbi:MAG: hypothetical protein P4L53_18340 [Candidatus Obscuribacterales bacterium]|nr:hypothetical protein [Candidatus Obscuribacterales bacterium]
MEAKDCPKPREFESHPKAGDSHSLSCSIAEQMMRDRLEKKTEITAKTDQPHLEKILSDPANRSAVDYGRIAKESGNGPILIGDSHRSFATKQDFIASLPELKKAGVQEVDFELLPSAMQKQLDNYASLLMNPSASKESISTERNKLVDHFLGIWDGGPNPRPMAEKLTDMIDGTIQAGLRPVGIEPPVERMQQRNEGLDLFHQGLEHLTPADQASFDKFWNLSTSDQDVTASKNQMLNDLQRSGWSTDQTDKFGRILEQMKAGEPPLDLAGIKLPLPERGPVIDAVNETFESKLSNWRNQNWMQVIEKQVHDGKKVAVFGGGAHFGHAEQDETISQLLEKVGIQSITVMKTGGDLERIRSERKAEAAKAHEPFEELPPEMHSVASSKARLSDKKFGYRFDSHHSRQADFVVHLPNDIME